MLLKTQGFQICFLKSWSVDGQLKYYSNFCIWNHLKYPNRKYHYFPWYSYHQRKGNSLQWNIGIQYELIRNLARNFLIDAFKFIANLAIPRGLKWKPFLPKWSTVRFLFFTVGVSNSSSISFRFDIVKPALPSSTCITDWDKITLQFSSESNITVFSWRSLSSIFLEVMFLTLLVPTCKTT